MPFQIALLYDKMLKGMPLNIISYKKAIWKGIEGHLKGIVQKLEDSLSALLGRVWWNKTPFSRMALSAVNPLVRRNPFYGCRVGTTLAL